MEGPLYRAAQSGNLEASVAAIRVIGQLRTAPAHRPTQPSPGAKLQGKGSLHRLCGPSQSDLAEIELHGIYNYTSF